MEAELDRIEEGELDWRRVLDDFYAPFQLQLKEGESKSDLIIREIVTGDDGKDCPECGRPLIVRWNRYGRFLGCSGYPECRYTESLDREPVAEPKPTGEKCPSCGGEMVEREGRFGAFIACSNYPKCKYTRPRTIPGLKCPTCGVGEIAGKRTRRGKPFWGCTRYPDCDWSVWDEPVPVACEVCDAPFLVRKSTKKQGVFLKCIKCDAVVADPAEPAGGPAGDADGDGRGTAKPSPRRGKPAAAGTGGDGTGTKKRTRTARPRSGGR
jgi:DNA topoisomerase-1